MKLDENINNNESLCTYWQNLEKSEFDYSNEESPSIMLVLNMDGTTLGYDSYSEYYEERANSLLEKVTHIVQYIDINMMPIIKEGRISILFSMIRRLRRELDILDHLIRNNFPLNKDREDYETFKPGFKLREKIGKIFDQVDKRSEKLLYFSELESISTGVNLMPHDYCFPKYNYPDEDYSYSLDFSNNETNELEFEICDKVNVSTEELNIAIPKINAATICLIHYYNDEPINEINVKELGEKYGIKTTTYLVKRYKMLAKDQTRRTGVPSFLKKSIIIKPFLNEKGRKDLDIDIEYFHYRYN